VGQGVVIEAILKRDRLIVAGGLAALAALAWAYTLWLALGMQGGPMPITMAMPQPHGWTAVDFLLMLVMWDVMMVAMMTPAVTPVVLLVAAVNRQRAGGVGGGMSIAAFVAGYLLAWTGFSLAATLAQWGLHDQALLSNAMGKVGGWLGPALLVAAGLYQLTPAKGLCIRHCRSPLQFLMTSWRPGPRGGLVMGLRHGLYCVGCCWALMALLFVAGIMNILWIAGLAALVLIEKLSGPGVWVGRLVGVLLIAWGVWLAWLAA
jgi:predicted metal-binding membrane protein